MNLKELYYTIISRENVNYLSLKPNMRIALVTSIDDLDIMKIDRVGLGRASPSEHMRYMTIAKICPGQSAMSLDKEGIVSQNKLMEVTSYSSLYSSDNSQWYELGVLCEKIYRGYWAYIKKNTAIKKITKPEMKEIEKAKILSI